MHHMSIITLIELTKKLRNEFNVIVDHGDEIPPEKKEFQPRKLNGNEGNIK